MKERVRCMVWKWCPKPGGPFKRDLVCPHSTWHTRTRECTVTGTFYDCPGCYGIGSPHTIREINDDNE